MLSHKSFIILALTFDSIWVNFHIFYEVGIPFHSFAHDYLIPEALVENTILSPFNFLNTLVKNHVSVLSHFSHTQFCATLQSVVHQTPLSMGFSKQEYWSGLPCPSSSWPFIPLPPLKFNLWSLLHKVLCNTGWDQGRPSAWLPGFHENTWETRKPGTQVWGWVWAGE